MDGTVQQSEQVTDDGDLLFGDRAFVREVSDEMSDAFMIRIDAVGIGDLAQA